ncbi:putative nuclease HARBI1 [Lucilia sericata]|uniref:putative nuclease HARBI1 n=1 Tax=Lucilia sericata TaxID=13632 RepID=UPI0018A80226|nr:putative nuclease HARBI1 [Lucilia sericata]
MEAKSIILEDLLESSSSSKEEDMYPLLLERNFSGNKTTFREVANVFDMSLSNLHNSFQQILKFLLDEIASEAIKKVISNDFQQVSQKISGFPNVLGCIDGSYISVRTPKHKIRSTYANRHDTVSITLQGICDSKLRFLDVYTGVPSKELQNLCAPNYHLLGDSAYPLREYLLTPFHDYGNLSDSEKNYNLKFCQSRVKIQNAFGVLKSRF